MNTERSILVFYTLCFIGFGLPGVFLPDQFSSLIQLEFISAAGKTEFVAAYGGLIIGIGLFLLYCLKTDVFTGLMSIFIIVGSLFFGRLSGLLMGGGIDNIQITFFSLELITLLIIGFILIRTNQLKTPISSQ